MLADILQALQKHETPPPQLAKPIIDNIQSVLTIAELRICKYTDKTLLASLATCSAEKVQIQPLLLNFSSEFGKNFQNKGCSGQAISSSDSVQCLGKR
jgi:hypothetical protein